MSQSTSIEWTATVHPDGTVTKGSTWNPTRGCSRVSPGCLNCYAETIATRFSDEGQPFHLFASRTPKPHWTGKVGIVEKHLLDPLHWKTPRKIFVNSMSDLFHEDLGWEQIDKVFAVMASCPQHTFQILTKRPKNMQRYLDLTHRSSIPGSTAFSNRLPLPNVWLGVSVENQATANERIPLLLQAPASVRFVSYEPALEAVDFSYHGCNALPIYREAETVTDRLMPSGESLVRPGRKGWIRHDGRKVDQIIVGGESGPGARPFDISWARQTIEQCKSAGVACFVKQLGKRPYPGSLGSGHMPEMALKDRKGGNMEEWPEDLRVRQWPGAIQTSRT